MTCWCLFWRESSLSVDAVLWWLSPLPKLVVPAAKWSSRKWKKNINLIRHFVCFQHHAAQRCNTFSFSRLKICFSPWKLKFVFNKRNNTPIYKLRRRRLLIDFTELVGGGEDEDKNANGIFILMIHERYSTSSFTMNHIEMKKKKPHSFAILKLFTRSVHAPLGKKIQLIEEIIIINANTSIVRS